MLGQSWYSVSKASTAGGLIPVEPDEATTAADWKPVGRNSIRSTACVIQLEHRNRQDQTAPKFADTPVGYQESKGRHWRLLMSENKPSNKDSGDSANQVFDIERIKELIELMRENELSEIDLRHSQQRIRLRSDKNSPPTYVAGAPVSAGAVPAAPGPAPLPAVQAAAADGGEDESHIEYVRSPMVGTFYAKPNPTSENYVKVGDLVDATTTVCTVEAMKMFNEIPAGVSGKIVAILVENEDPVDVNKPLFKIDTRA